MKYFLLLLSIIIISCNSTGKKKNDDSVSSPLHFDGMYKSGSQTNEATGDQSTSYLRFYDDGTVINVSSGGTPEQISKWFVKGHDNVSEGTYTIQGSDISFTSAGHNADVDYKGKIVNKELLQLHTKSLSNNNEADITYSFVQQ